MTLDYNKQFELCEMPARNDFTHRVTAACFAAAVDSFRWAANPDTTTQSLRVKLTNTIIRNPDFATKPAAWYLAGQEAITEEGQITDGYMFTTLSTPTVYDEIAKQLLGE